MSDGCKTFKSRIEFLYCHFILQLGSGQVSAFTKIGQQIKTTSEMNRYCFTDAYVVEEYIIVRYVRYY